MSEDPKDLLQRIADGDQDALGAFYRLFEGRIYRFALSRLNDAFDAADILNEVMFEVWRGAARFEGRSAVSSWVLGIAHHKTIDRLRKRTPELVEEVNTGAADETTPSPADVASAAEDAVLVQRCMEQLSRAHRDVVHLAFFEDLSYREIAVIVECPEGTVKTRMYHAKRALQDCLARSMGCMP